MLERPSRGGTFSLLSRTAPPLPRRCPGLFGGERATRPAAIAYTTVVEGGGPGRSFLKKRWTYTLR